MAEQTPNENEGQAPQQQFAIQKIYIKDVSFETPNSPQIFTEKWSPEVNLQLQSKIEKLNDNVFEVIMSLTVTAKMQDKTAYLAEVQQAGIFTIAGFEQEQLNAMTGAYCPTVLYPFAREAVSDLVTKGGFPQLLLAPINFDALYQQQIQQVNAKVEQPTAATH